MITLSRTLLKKVRIALCRGFGIKAKQKGPPITLVGDEHGVTLRAGNEDFAIEYRIAGAASMCEIRAPFELLRRCEGTRSRETVTFRQEGDIVFADWQDGPMPMTAELPATEEPDAFPSLPDNFVPNPPRLLDSLRDAALTTGNSTRFGLDHIRLRGGIGQIAASDSRQMLVQHGFGFPWHDDRLIPANSLLSTGELQSGALVEVGCTVDFVVIAAGPWTIWLRHAGKVRFPDIDNLVGTANQAKATMHVADADAAFLTETVSKLDSSDSLNDPVTVDLNGAVTLRAAATSSQKLTDIVLSQSHREGAAIRFATNRGYLSRAMKLGFRSISVNDTETPVRCHEPTRDYVWATLGKDAIVKPQPDALRIQSTPTPNDNHHHPKEENAPEMPHNATTDQEHQTASELISSAEHLKASLRESQNAVTSLIAGLKRHRQQTKKIRSAVATLKQLQAVDA